MAKKYCRFRRSVGAPFAQRSIIVPVTITYKSIYDPPSARPTAIALLVRRYGFLIAFLATAEAPHHRSLGDDPAEIECFRYKTTRGTKKIGQ